MRYLVDLSITNPPLFNKFINGNDRTASLSLTTFSLPSTRGTKWQSSEILIWKVVGWKLWKMRSLGINLMLWKMECYAFYHKWFVQNKILFNLPISRSSDLLIKFWQELLSHWRGRSCSFRCYNKVLFTNAISAPISLYAKFAGFRGYNLFRNPPCPGLTKTHFKYSDSSGYYSDFHLINSFYSNKIHMTRPSSFVRNTLYAKFAGIQGYSFFVGLCDFIFPMTHFKYF
jgi:hypothetical protein